MTAESSASIPAGPPVGGQERAIRVIVEALEAGTGRIATVENLPGRDGAGAEDVGPGPACG